MRFLAFMIPEGGSAEERPEDESGFYARPNQEKRNNLFGLNNQGRHSTQKQCASRRSWASSCLF